MLCGGLYVGQQIAALERGDVLVYVAQFSLDDAQALGDEMGGGDGHLVLVLHPVFAVYGDDGVQHVLGALGELVLIGQVDNCCLLLADACRERRLDMVGHGIEVGASHMQFPALMSIDEGRIARCLVYAYIAHRRADGLAQLALYLLVRFHLVSSLVGATHMYDRKQIAMLYLYIQIGALHIVQAIEMNGYRQRSAIESHRMEGTVFTVVYVEFELLASLQQDGWRLDGNQLVVDVRLASRESHVGEHTGHIAVDALALAVFLDEDGCRALIDTRRGEEVISGYAQGDDERDNKPSPAHKAQIH